MKNLILILSFLVGYEAFSACTTISRTNNAANSVLTSAKYNADINTAYTAINSLDGECLQAATVKEAALDSTELEPIYYGITEGCKAVYNDSNTINIENCTMGINGNFLRTATTTSVTWACSGCSSESASTRYYVYVKGDSSGSTLTPLILTGAPQSDGYDTSGNKVIASFYNNASSSIVENRIAQWRKNKFDDPVTLSARIANNGTATITSQQGTPVASVNRNSNGNVSVNLVTGMFTAIPAVQMSICDASSNGDEGMFLNSIGVTGLVTALTADSAAYDKPFCITFTRQGSDIW